MTWVRVSLTTGASAVVGDEEGAPSITQPIARGDVPLDMIEFGPETDAVFSDRDQELLRTLATHTELALDNALLAARVVHAQEAERRRIERNLHNGVQQRLVALLAGLGLAREQATTRPDRVAPTLGGRYETR